MCVSATSGRSSAGEPHPPAVERDQVSRHVCHSCLRRPGWPPSLVATTNSSRRFDRRRGPFCQAIRTGDGTGGPRSPAPGGSATGAWLDPMMRVENVIQYGRRTRASALPGSAPRDATGHPDLGEGDRDGPGPAHVRQPRRAALPHHPHASWQPVPGLDAELDPKADHGETTYRGTGRLPGRKALITGGDSGIGAAVAIAFAREGADVALGYLPEEQVDADAIGEVVRARAGPACCCPVTSGTARSAGGSWPTRSTGSGGLDILVNNAAHQVYHQTFDELDEADLDRTIRTNLYAMFWITRDALPHLHPGRDDHQQHVRAGLQPVADDHQLRLHQVRHHRLHEGAGGGPRAARHPRQRGGARAGVDPAAGLRRPAGGEAGRIRRARPGSGAPASRWSRRPPTCSSRRRSPASWWARSSTSTAARTCPDGRADAGATGRLAAPATRSQNDNGPAGSLESGEDRCSHTAAASPAPCPAGRRRCAG